ncbi:MAG: response regulator transcription factor [Candidatus Acidiferrales bacterium]
MRESLARILNKRTDMWAQPSQEINDATAETIRESEASILLFDSADAILSRDELVQDILGEGLRWKAIVIGMEADERIFLETVRRGVSGYLLKDASAVDIVDAVRTVARGEVVCPPCLCRILFRFVSRQVMPLPNQRVRDQIGLTRREQQLLPLIARGLTNKEIASNLNLSDHTEKNHIHHILSKVGAEDRLGVMEVCRTHGVEV